MLGSTNARTSCDTDSTIILILFRIVEHRRYRRSTLTRLARPGLSNRPCRRITTYLCFEIRKVNIVERPYELTLRSEESEETLIVDVEAKPLGGRVQVCTIDENRQTLIWIKVHHRNPFQGSIQQCDRGASGAG